LRSINPFELWFFFKPKFFFRKLRVQKWPKYVILSCGFKKCFGGENGNAYVTPISYSVKVWGDNLTWLNFQFWGHHGVFRPFLGVERRKRVKNQHYHRLNTPKMCPQKKLQTLEYIVKNKSTLCDNNCLTYLKKLSVVFFCPLTVLWYTFCAKTNEIGIREHKTWWAFKLTLLHDYLRYDTT
jgi:hypothetical protein